MKRLRCWPDRIRKHKDQAPPSKKRTIFVMSVKERNRNKEETSHDGHYKEMGQKYFD